MVEHAAPPAGCGAVGSVRRPLGLAMSARWRAIPGYLDYEASAAGEIRRARASKYGHFPKGYVLKPKLDDGYWRLCLMVGKREVTRCVHQLVALAFIGPRPAGMQVRHKDGVRTNNHFKNLCWGTVKDNADDRIGHGTSPVGEKNPRAKLTELNVKNIRRLHREGFSNREILRGYAETGIRYSMIGMIVTRKNWRHVQ